MLIGVRHGDWLRDRVCKTCAARLGVTPTVTGVAVWALAWISASKCGSIIANPPTPWRHPISCAVTVAVDFHSQSCAFAMEIQDVGADRMLPAKRKPFEPAALQSAP
jgi:hypothetical protein